MANRSLYKEQLRRLFPRGRLWDTPIGGILDKFIDALSVELERIDGRAQTLIREADPRTTNELLPDWIRVSGYPGPCGSIAQTDEEIRQWIVSLLTAIGPQNKAFYVTLAESLGYDITVDDISEYLPFQVGRSKVGDRLTNAGWAHTFAISFEQTEALRYFRVGSHRVGDRLVEFGDDLLECVINQHKQAHTIVLFKRRGNLVGSAIVGEAILG